MLRERRLQKLMLFLSGAWWCGAWWFDNVLHALVRLHASPVSAVPSVGCGAACVLFVDCMVCDTF